MNPLEIALKSVEGFIDVCFSKGYVWYFIIGVIILLILVFMGKL